MPWFIKTESFKAETLSLSLQKRQAIIAIHLEWVKGLEKLGIEIASGYLVNKEKQPGGGGLLVFKAKSFEEAHSIISDDPMIVNELVEWTLQEWIPIFGELLTSNAI